MPIDPDTQGYVRNQFFTRTASNPDDYTIDLKPNFVYQVSEGSHYGYGMLEVDGRLYHSVALGHKINYARFDLGILQGAFG